MKEIDRLSQLTKRIDAMDESLEIIVKSQGRINTEIITSLSSVLNDTQKKELIDHLTNIIDDTKKDIEEL